MIPRGEETVRFAPRDNPRRKKTGNSYNPTTLRRSTRHGVGKAYSNLRAPITVTPYEPMSSRVRHSVPFLAGQDDIPRSDDEDEAPTSISNAYNEPNLGIGSEPTEGVDLSAAEQTTALSQQVSSPPDISNRLPDSLLLTHAPTSNLNQLPAPVSHLSASDPLMSSLSIGRIILGQVPSAAQGGSDDSTNLDHSAVTHTTHPAITAGMIVSTPSEPSYVPSDQGPSFTQSLQADGPWFDPPADIEQRQNQRHHSRLYLEEALLHGPTKRHARVYAVEWYARNKPQIYTPNPRASNQPDNSKKYQGSFSIVEQHLIFPAGHSMVYEIICVDPFPIGYTSVERGIVFAESVISARLGAGGPSYALQRFMKDKLSRRRNELIKLTSGVIISKYGLPAVAELDDLDAYHRARDLIQDDSFVNQDESQPGGIYEFTHPAIVSVLKILFFKFNPKLGMVFIDRLVAGDAPGTPWHNTRRDHSPEALRGTPTEAIAFACTLIKHVLFNYKQVTMGELVAKFEGKEYTSHWARFHRKLVMLPNLGELRRELLNEIKTHYAKAHPYDPNESMVEEDVLW
ncbi:hypothetical protein RSOL_290900, partial [Rhizoctonia solani AG-3 Rhs1AP]